MNHDLTVDIDTSMSLCGDSLVPRDSVPIVISEIELRSIPIKLQAIDVKTIGYQFPRSGGGIRIFRGGAGEDAVKPYSQPEALKPLDADAAREAATMPGADTNDANATWRIAPKPSVLPRRLLADIINIGMRWWLRNVPPAHTDAFVAPSNSIGQPCACKSLDGSICTGNHRARDPLQCS